MGPRLRQLLTSFRRPGTPAWIAGVTLLRHGCRISAARAYDYLLTERSSRSLKPILAHRGAALFGYFLLREQEKVTRQPVRERADAYELNYYPDF